MKSSSNHKPTDFHHLTARLKLPLAPAFLTEPISKTSLRLKQENDQREEEETDDLALLTNRSGRDDKKVVVENDKLAKEYGNNGALEALNQSLASLLMNYIPSLGTVLLSYLEPPMLIMNDQLGGEELRRPLTKTTRVPILTIPGNGWGIVDVEVKLLGWRPTIGQKLIGRPTLSSPSHLSLVLYRTFNASINETHLRSAGFHYDINFEVPANWKSIGEPTSTNNIQPPRLDLLHEHKDRGCWVDANGVVVGGDEGTVSFTVIGLTIANHMISVIGSLLDDPFSIEAPIRPIQPRMAMKRGLNRPAEPESSSTDSSDDESRKGTSSRSQIKTPPTIHSASIPRPPLPHDPLVPPPTTSSTFPPPLTATNLKRLDSALLQPSIPPTLAPSSSSIPRDKSKKIKKKSNKRSLDALEEKPSRTPNPSSIRPHNSQPLAVPIPPPSSSSKPLSRKKKVKTT